MSKWDEQILVVNRKELFNNEENHFYGFIKKEDDTLVIKWMTANEAKEEENYETWSEFLKPIF